MDKYKMENPIKTITPAKAGIPFFYNRTKWDARLRGHD